MTGGPPAVVATDLDGTLLRSDGSVSDRTRAALARVEDAGALLVLVTGRPPRWMAPVARETGHHGIAICANGALRYDLATERVVGRDPFPPGSAAAVVAALRDAVPGLVFAVERPEGFAREPGYRSAVEIHEDVPVGAVEELLAEGETVKLLARLDAGDPDELLSRARSAVGDLATLTRSSPSALLEISSAGVTKASALERLAQEHGVGADGVLAFGDMPNDLPMLAWAGTGVAVANAHPQVIAVAHEVAPANDDDGVARVLERVFA